MSVSRIFIGINLPVGCPFRIYFAVWQHFNASEIYLKVSLAISLNHRSVGSRVGPKELMILWKAREFFLEERKEASRKFELLRYRNLFKFMCESSERTVASFSLLLCKFFRPWESLRIFTNIINFKYPLKILKRNLRTEMRKNL